MIREARCVLLACDGQHCPAVVSDPDGEGQIHFDTAEEARGYAVEHAGWSRHEGQDLCPSCTCAVHGHEWADWLHLAPGKLPPCRWCDRCSAQMEGQGVTSHD